MMMMIISQMKVFRAISIVFCVCFAWLCVSGQNGSTNRLLVRQGSPFHYSVIDNTYEPAVNRNDKPSRRIEVLLDKAAFSRENLVALFKLLMKRHPRPTSLIIDVFTDPADIETPEEISAGKTSEEKGGELKSDNALFIRNGNRMFFYMYFINGDFDQVEMK